MTDVLTLYDTSTSYVYPRTEFESRCRSGERIFMAATEFDKLKTVYEQICNAHNGIAEFRGKLLTLLPIASGAGIFLLLSKDLNPK